MVKGRRIKVLSPEAKQWANDTIFLATAWRLNNKWITANDKVIVRFWFYFPDRRKRDTHNTLKLTLDCFEAASIYENDRYALPQIMDFEVDRNNPRVEVEFELFDGKTKS